MRRQAKINLIFLSLFISLIGFAADKTANSASAPNICYLCGLRTEGPKKICEECYAKIKEKPPAFTFKGAKLENVQFQDIDD